MSKVKDCGQVFTPDYLVCNILDTAGYLGENVLSKHIIDNSCGDGAFLVEIVERYCSVFFKTNNDINVLSIELQTYIHGIESDEIAYKSCLKNLDYVVSKYNLFDVKWDILFGDSLKITKYNDMMDYVVGNPPYVRVHNFKENYECIKRFSFSNGGMSDLYLVFFEIGFNMLKKGGYLCYITPSSWINSVAGNVLRQYIKNKSNIVQLIDLGHYQPFKATTYTLISLFQKDVIHTNFNFYEYDEFCKDKVFVEKLTIDDVFINDIIYLSSKANLNLLRDIKYDIVKQYVLVKNGFATLNDSIFIKQEFDFEEYVISICKASTGKWYKAIFPYDEHGVPISKDLLFQNEKVRNYLLENQEMLLKDKTEEENPYWYLYGRTQALKDVYKDKYSVSTVVKDVNSIKLNFVPAGSGVYSGLYIMTKVPLNMLEQALFCEDFVGYIRLLRKYKSGGYYTFNSKELETYLNYKLSKIINNSHEKYAIEQSVFGDNRTLF